MSEENVEIVRRLYRAMDTRDLNAVAEFVHPDLVWVPDRRIGEGPIEGRETVIRFFADRADVFGEIHAEPERITPNGDKVLVFVRVTGRGEASGASFDIHVGHVWTVRDGVVVRGEGYGHREDALGAAGLSE